MGTEGVLGLNKSIISIGTVTHATKAKKILAEIGITTKLIKNNSEIGGGCVYGIEFDYRERFRILKILKDNNIPTV